MQLRKFISQKSKMGHMQCLVLLFWINFPLSGMIAGAKGGIAGAVFGLAYGSWVGTWIVITFQGIFYIVDLILPLFKLPRNEKIDCAILLSTILILYLVGFILIMGVTASYIKLHIDAFTTVCGAIFSLIVLFAYDQSVIHRVERHNKQIIASLKRDDHQ